MKSLWIAAAIAAGSSTLPATADSTRSPYAGQESRTVKALSETQVRDYLAGAGAGYAKTAELNSYPGPRHALDLGGRLQLNPAQRSVLEAAFGRMQAEAIRLGQELLARERELDRLFADRRIDQGRLAALTAEIGALDGRLRSVHLIAHLETSAVLSRHQIALYDQARGYGDAAAAPDGHAH